MKYKKDLTLSFFLVFTLASTPACFSAEAPAPEQVQAEEEQDSTSTNVKQNSPTSIKDILAKLEKELQEKNKRIADDPIEQFLREFEEENGGKGLNLSTWDKVSAAVAYARMSGQEAGGSLLSHITNNQLLYSSVSALLLATGVGCYLATTSSEPEQDSQDKDKQN